MGQSMGDRRAMTGWQWFGTLVGYLVYIIILIFLFFYKPFEALFNIVAYGLSYENSIFWVALITGIIGFCLFHWRAYRIHIVQQHNVEAMVLSSLKGSTYTAILLGGGATLQAVQLMCAYLLQNDYVLDAAFGKRLASVLALVVLTGLFCVIYWLLKVIKPANNRERPRASGNY
jgi:hypothetical protein